MTALFRAEWLKLSGNRWAVTFLVWIFPISALFLSVGAIVLSFISPDVRQVAQITTWQNGFLNPWSFPNSEIGRFAIVAFTAIVFASEYQQGTWKNLITRRQRWVIMANKFLTLGLFITLAFILLSLVIGVGSVILGQVVGHPMGAFDMTIFGTFLRDLSLQMSLTFAGTFISAGYAAIGAMLSRHVMATIIIGMVATLGEPSTLLIVSLARGLFKIDLYGLYAFTPSYNMGNITASQMGTVFAPVAPEGFIPFSQTASWLILLVWVVALIGLSIHNFTRPDITS